MTETHPTPPSMRLIEDVSHAFGVAHKLADFYATTATLLVSPQHFGYSRAFLLTYDHKTGQYHGRLALGAQSEKDHQRFRDQQGKGNVSGPPHTGMLLDTAMLLQRDAIGFHLNEQFQHLHLPADQLPADHLVTLIAQSARARLYQPSDALMAGISHIFELPLIAGTLHTRQGLHTLVIADRLYEDEPLNPQALIPFQWLMNHAQIALQNVELVEELTRTTEQMQEVDRIKNNFLNIVSHELRTPLTSIIGFTHLLKDGQAGPVTEPQRDLLERVSNHSLHLQNMVNDILEIAEVGSGGIVNVTLQKVDPLDTLWQVIPRVDSRKSTREVTIEPVVDGPIPNIQADPVALERIYYHLLDNAIKFIPHAGSVKVHFAHDATHMRITVADDGIGISPDKVKRIFDHFYQVDYRLERVYGGMGIGLTIVKLLLDATGGTLHIQSTPNEGSEFTVCYPLAK